MAELHLGATADGPYRLPRERLVTHGVVLGMTGSGKTGLCVDLLEEVALSGVPALVIDPKGDLAHLGSPWPDDVEERWLAGLTASGVGADRIEALRRTVEVVVHTPGSTAHRPVDVLGSLAPPQGASAEALAEAATTAAAALLGLAGVHGDPHRDPRLVLAATLVRTAWEAGEVLSAEQVVLRLVDPPIAKVGVFPVDTFLPRAERMQLAVALNAVLAAPTAAAWHQGEALDLDAMLAPVDGRVPVRVFYLAHLDDASRAFFVSLLLGRVVTWMRRQAGTDDLRAMLFFDEVFGFLPPAPRQPPSKPPLLTLLKQGRAAGLGVVLCTQNPVDLDYKALANTGWRAIGRLSTPQDRAKVVEGLAGLGDDEADLSERIADLPPWTFLVRDVRAPAAVEVKSRWAISWLGGPVTLEQLRARPSAAVGAVPPAKQTSDADATAPASADDVALADPPVLPDDLPQRWLPLALRFRPPLLPLLGEGRGARADGAVVHRAWLVADLRMLFDERGGFRHERHAVRLVPLEGGEPVAVDLPELEASAPSGARYLPLPEGADESRELDRLTREVRDEVLRGETTQLFRHRATGLRSEGGESREAFEARVEAAVQDRIDAEVAKLRDKVERRVDSLEAKREKAERDRARHEADAQARLATEVVNAGETLFGMLFGGRSRSLTTAMSKRQSTARAKERASEAEAKVRDLDRDLYEAEIELQEDIAAIERDARRDADAIEVTEVGLERDDLQVDFTLLWVPETRPL